MPNTVPRTGRYRVASHRFGGNADDWYSQLPTVGTRYVVGSIVQEEPDLPPSDAGRQFDGHHPDEGPRATAEVSSSTGEE
jgi:hypothetical protein